MNPERPKFHFAPKRNWINDPNGLIYFKGEFHLFYQYNPNGDQWGDISWGHAVSTDLINWNELPVAIPATPQLMAFSGSIVSYQAPTTEGAEETESEDALWAFYTGFNRETKIQAQHLTISHDRGRTFHPFSDDPIIDIGSKDFRDPKVFWHSASKRWVMVLVAALEQQVWIYNSTNLTDWEKVSSFGPIGSAHNNIWEVPDLVELDLRDPCGLLVGKSWVLFVSVNHGTPYGGSGVQYFIGDFDGKIFQVNESYLRSSPPQPQEIIASFDCTDFPDGWKVSGDAWGEGPTVGGVDGQEFVSGFTGRRLANSFHGGNAGKGVLESPVFKLNKRYLNFLVGGDTDYGTRIELVIDGQVRLYSSGPGSNELVWHNLDVGAWIGRQAFVRAIDELECGHLLIAEIALTDEPIKPVNYKDITLWVDHGRDFYAPITFSNAPEGRHLWLGWMNNWAYAGKVPPRPWRGQMSLPRELDVLETPDGKFLRQSPAREIRSIAQINQTHQFNNISASDLAEFFAKSHFVHNCWHLKFALEVQSLSSEFGIKISWTSESKVLIGFDPFNSVFFVDRFTSNPAFKGQTERHEGKRITSTQILRVEIWVDGNTVEVFGDDGLVVISDLIFPDDNENPLELFFGPENPKLSSLSFTPIERTS